MEKIKEILSKIKDFLTSHPKFAIFLFGFIVGFILGTIF